MTVIVNDFEVVAEPPPASESPAGSGASAPPEGPTPHEVELINRRQHERAARVHAD
jgi:hypothetical protein